VRIHHVALRTQDVERLRAFYEDVLGLRVLRRDEARGSVWLDADGAVVMIERAEAGEPRVPGGSMELVAFAVEDKEAWRVRLGAGAVEAETGHTLYFRDPDGRRVAVSDYPLARSS
jgi:catechol 2,3-dioxygenase-like lactoylglutathione lyase family enzyme